MPTFMVVGAMKAGTTSLYRYLVSHPEVFMAREKEPDFYVAEKAWSRGLPWYQSLFDGADGATAIGEASTSYTKCTEFPGVPERIAAQLPDVKLIYLLRHPVERIRSMYLHNVIVGRERRPLEVAVLQDPMYLDASRYAMQLEAFDVCFPPEQILTVTSESLRSDAAGVLERVGSFLGLRDPTGFDLTPQHQNDTAARRVDTSTTRWVRRLPGYQRALNLAPGRVVRLARTAVTTELPADRATMTATTRATLEELLRDDVQRLRARVGASVDVWGLGTGLGP